MYHKMYDRFYSELKRSDEALLEIKMNLRVFDSMTVASMRQTEAIALVIVFVFAVSFFKAERKTLLNT